MRTPPKSEILADSFPPAKRGQAFALYGVAALYYWVVCLVLSFVQGRLEHRLERYVAR